MFIVLALETALIVAIHLSASPTYAIPLDSLGEWLRTSDPSVSLVAVARLVALAIGYWLLVTTVLYALAHHLGWESMTAALRWITLPFVRRIVQGVTAMSLTGASLMAPAALSVGPVLAQDDAVVAQATDDSTTSTDDPTAGEFEPDAAGWPEPGVEGDFWRPSAVVPVQQPSNRHTVVPGDHLWGIAASHLRASVEHEPTEDEICQYWVRVIDANRGSLRSGDPDMIFPNETIALPDVFSE